MTMTRLPPASRESGHSIVARLGARWIFFLLVPLFAPLCSFGAGAGMHDIVRREGATLHEGSRAFRFVGLAAPNLHQNEGQLLPDGSNRWPDEYELRDVLGSLHQLGARATRCFGFSLASPKDKEAAYITGPAQYNEDAFRHFDLMLALCHEYDIRVIIPLIDSHSFATVRGVDEFAAFRSKPGLAFWSDDELKNDFKRTIAGIVNRRNTVTGVLYKDDPAILAWQLGNELSSYGPDRHIEGKTFDPLLLAWSKEMAAYLKQIDPQHLVMEAGGDRAALLADPNIDIMSEHLYEYWARLSGRSTDLAQSLVRAEHEIAGKKALIVDEFGMADVSTLLPLLDELPRLRVSGALLWSIRGHRRDGGFYYHNESGTRYNSYHWPGFSVGQSYDERTLFGLLRETAKRIQPTSLPAEIPPPAPAPVLQPITNWSRIMWRGSTGASGYRLERAASDKGPWTVLYDRAEDAVVSDVKTFEESHASESPALASDPAARDGHTYFYRVKAFNVAGESSYSNIQSYSAP